MADEWTADDSSAVDFFNPHALNDSDEDLDDGYQDSSSVVHQEDSDIVAHEDGSFGWSAPANQASDGEDDHEEQPDEHDDDPTGLNALDSALGELEIEAEAALQHEDVKASNASLADVSSQQQHHHQDDTAATTAAAAEPPTPAAPATVNYDISRYWHDSASGWYYDHHKSEYTMTPEPLEPEPEPEPVQPAEPEPEPVELLHAHTHYVPPTPISQHGDEAPEKVAALYQHHVEEQQVSKPTRDAGETQASAAAATSTVAVSVAAAAAAAAAERMQRQDSMKSTPSFVMTVTEAESLPTPTSDAKADSVSSNNNNNNDDDDDWDKPTIKRTGSLRRSLRRGRESTDADLAIDAITMRRRSMLNDSDEEQELEEQDRLADKIDREEEQRQREQEQRRLAREQQQQQQRQEIVPPVAVAAAVPQAVLLTQLTHASTNSIDSIGSNIASSDSGSVSNLPLPARVLSVSSLHRLDDSPSVEQRSTLPHTLEQDEDQEEEAEEADADEAQAVARPRRATFQDSESSTHLNDDDLEELDHVSYPSITSMASMASIDPALLRTATVGAASIQPAISMQSVSYVEDDESASAAGHSYYEEASAGGEEAQPETSLPAASAHLRGSSGAAAGDSMTFDPDDPNAIDSVLDGFDATLKEFDTASLNDDSRAGSRSVSRQVSMSLRPLAPVRRTSILRPASMVVPSSHALSSSPTGTTISAASSGSWNNSNGEIAATMSLASIPLYESGDGDLMFVNPMADMTTDDEADAASVAPSTWSGRRSHQSETGTFILHPDDDILYANGLRVAEQRGRRGSAVSAVSSGTFIHHSQSPSEGNEQPPMSPTHSHSPSVMTTVLVQSPTHSASPSVVYNDHTDVEEDDPEEDHGQLTITNPTAAYALMQQRHSDSRSSLISSKAAPPPPPVRNPFTVLVPSASVTAMAAPPPPVITVTNPTRPPSVYTDVSPLNVSALPPTSTGLSRELSGSTTSMVTLMAGGGGAGGPGMSESSQQPLSRSHSIQLDDEAISASVHVPKLNGANSSSGLFRVGSVESAHPKRTRTSSGGDRTLVGINAVTGAPMQPVASTPTSGPVAPNYVPSPLSSNAQLAAVPEDDAPAPGQLVRSFSSYSISGVALPITASMIGSRSELAGPFAPGPALLVNQEEQKHLVGRQAHASSTTYSRHSSSSSVPDRVVHREQDPRRESERTRESTRDRNHSRDQYRGDAHRDQYRDGPRDRERDREREKERDREHRSSRPRSRYRDYHYDEGSDSTSTSSSESSSSSSSSSSDEPRYQDRDRHRKHRKHRRHGKKARRHSRRRERSRRHHGHQQVVHAPAIPSGPNQRRWAVEGSVPTGFEVRVDQTTGETFYFDAATMTYYDQGYIEHARASPSTLPIPPGWNMRKDHRTAKVFFVNHNSQSTTWVDPRDRFTRPFTFAECEGDELPYAWEQASDAVVGLYFVNHSTRTTQIEDPRISAHIVQQRMLKDFLETAQADLTRKQELLELKKRRLGIAEEEVAYLTSRLDRPQSVAMPSSAAAAVTAGYQHGLVHNNSLQHLSGGLHASGSYAQTFDPDTLKVDIAAAKQRVASLRLEMESLDNVVQYEREGMEILQDVDRRIDANPDYQLDDARRAIEELNAMRALLRENQAEKAELRRQLVQMREEYVTNSRMQEYLVYNELDKRQFKNELVQWLAANVVDPDQINSAVAARLEEHLDQRELAFDVDELAASLTSIWPAITKLETMISQSEQFGDQLKSEISSISSGVDSRVGSRNPSRHGTLEKPRLARANMAASAAAGQHHPHHHHHHHQHHDHQQRHHDAYTAPPPAQFASSGSAHPVRAAAAHFTQNELLQSEEDEFADSHILKAKVEELVRMHEREKIELRKILADVHESVLSRQSLKTLLQRQEEEKEKLKIELASVEANYIPIERVQEVIATHEREKSELRAELQVLKKDLILGNMQNKPVSKSSALPPPPPSAFLPADLYPESSTFVDAMISNAHGDSDASATDEVVHNSGETPITRIDIELELAAAKREISGIQQQIRALKDMRTELMAGGSGEAAAAAHSAGAAQSARAATSMPRPLNASKGGVASPSLPSDKAASRSTVQERAPAVTFAETPAAAAVAASAASADVVSLDSMPRWIDDPVIQNLLQVDPESCNTKNTLRRRSQHKVAQLRTKAKSGGVDPLSFQEKIAYFTTYDIALPLPPPPPPAH
ncbi:hypothetical protein CAOG_07806 [Capsaspora owczarzaki ATCC 30864]|uniref:WW domain-containing protein n=1 Tax=Capsaspora owczarzaki (strain ATCC 30864) TaxID=595528 RepID=A0A0D2W0H7_CAPO3|nr:hypothetical protein CAOG_07806 [Capsaspora owczarzaki ATCC 30864]KJE97702.1 hypothetical protein CAOG_007806 [Capsaspora owczarzaki ATCC 30864]|eukprot:XP_004342879.1 hypothetical protein CAOG_07806 [Capsaspora owczarzaki ATCC 30864]